MHQCCDQIRTELNIPRYDIKDETSFPHDRIEPESHHGNDLHLHTRALHEPSLQDRNHLDVAGLNGTLDTSMKSRASRGSSGHVDSHDTSHVESHDTYNFKSTGSEDMFSTIRSEANNATLSDTQALKEYQQTISQQDNLVVKEESESEGEVHYQEPVQPEKAIPKIVSQEKAVIKPVQQITPQPADAVVNTEDKLPDKQRAASQQQSELDDDDDDYEDDYDEYDDDGDDEGGDYQPNTEQSATYRTDDDDF